jgi:hypothetical protein
MLRAKLLKGAYIELNQDSEGRWHWVLWYRWRTVGGLAEGHLIRPPPLRHREKRFGTADEAVEYFQDLRDRTPEYQ